MLGSRSITAVGGFIMSLAEKIFTCFQGKEDFTLKEAFKIQQILKAETISLEILFNRTEAV